MDGCYGHLQKAHSALRERMYVRKRKGESLTPRALAQEMAEQFQVEEYCQCSGSVARCVNAKYYYDDG